MSFRFLLWMAFLSLLLSGAAGWFFAGKHEPTLEQKTFLEHRKMLEADRARADEGGPEDWVRFGRAILTAPKSLQNPESAMFWFRKAADQGYVPGQVEVGKLYAKGIGVSQNYHRAMEWFQLAARLSKSAEAHFHIAEGYLRGHGVPQDLGAAVPYYLTAAKQGHPIAQFIIGSMYESGWGLEQDLIQAWIWYKRALPHAAEIAQHQEGYDVETALARVQAAMNDSQRLAAERGLNETGG